MVTDRYERMVGVPRRLPPNLERDLLIMGVDVRDARPGNVLVYEKFSHPALHPGAVLRSACHDEVHRPR